MSSLQVLSMLQFQFNRNHNVTLAIFQLFSKLNLYNISESLYDIDVIGTAKFHSGFIAKIDGSGILPTSYIATVNAAYVNQAFSPFHSSSFRFTLATLFV